MSPPEGIPIEGAEVEDDTIIEMVNVFGFQAQAPRNPGQPPEAYVVSFGQYAPPLWTKDARTRVTIIGKYMLTREVLESLVATGEQALKMQGGGSNGS